VTVLRTERLTRRRLRLGDLDRLAELYADPEMRRYFPDGTRSREETYAELTWFLEGHPRHPELGLWATVLTDSGIFIGRCGLLPWSTDGDGIPTLIHALEHGEGPAAAIGDPRGP